MPFHLWLTTPAFEVVDITFAMNFGWAKNREECARLVFYYPADKPQSNPIHHPTLAGVDFFRAHWDEPSSLNALVAVVGFGKAHEESRVCSASSRLPARTRIEDGVECLSEIVLFLQCVTRALQVGQADSCLATSKDTAIPKSTHWRIVQVGC